MLLVLAVLSVCLAVAALGLGAVLVIAPRMRLRRRAAMLGVANNASGTGTMRAINPGQRRIQERLHELEEEGKKRRRRDRIRGVLLRAGLEPDYRLYFLISLGGGIIGALAYLATGNPPIGALPAAAVAAIALPRIGLGLVAKRRQKVFTKHFASAIDIIVRGIRSGLPVGECFAIIGREIPEPVGAEFRMIVEGQRIGLPLEQLMRRGLERIPTAEFKFFAVVIQIQQQTGGNLADTLQNLSTMLRERKQARDKVKSLSTEAKSSAAIIGTIPFAIAGLLSLVDPNYMTPFLEVPLGKVMLFAVLIWMGIGILWMRKMINFEF